MDCSVCRWKQVNWPKKTSRKRWRVGEDLDKGFWGALEDTFEKVDLLDLEKAWKVRKGYFWDRMMKMLQADIQKVLFIHGKRLFRLALTPE